MKPHTRNQDDVRMSEQAAQWVGTLKDADDAQRAAFGAWLRVSPRHVEEFLLVAAAERAFDDLCRRSAKLDVDAILAEAAANVVPLTRSTVFDAPIPQVIAREKKTPWPWLVAAASVTAIAVAGWWAANTYPQWYGYSTRLGEQRAFDLNDGSIIHLNTQSRVKVRIDSGRREIRLVKGEALFRVARDVQRPFRVHVGASTIQAIGTQFNVYRSSQNTTVSVIEGLVRISQDGNAPPDAGVRTGATAPAPDTARHHGNSYGEKNNKNNSVSSGKDAGMDSGQVFAAGQGASIAAGGKITRNDEVDTAQVSAWRQRRLVFRGERLEDVAEQFNRYNHTPRIQVEPGLAADKQMAGVFDADDPESLVLFLNQYGDLDTERVGDRVVVIRAIGHRDPR